jgi:hypothetical protein
MRPWSIMDEIDPDPWAASEGLPEVADDDSYADGRHESRRDPYENAALPTDREDGPLGLDEYGVSTGERERREPLSARLARERPDVGAGLDDDADQDDARLVQDEDLDSRPTELDGAVPARGTTARGGRPDPTARLAEDTRQLAEERPVDPNLGSQISVYDRPLHGVGSPAALGETHHGDQPWVGAQVERPGSGYRSPEATEIAVDDGPSLGGLGGEEIAVHEMPAEQADLENAQASHEPYVILDADAELDGPVPDESRVVVIRTGADQPWDPEDLAVAMGLDPTPRNVERARQLLEQLGAAAIERTVP